VEPPILERETARLLESDKAWYEERLPLVEDRVRDRLDQLSGRLGDADWLDGAFSAGDLMMVSVLLRLKSSGILDEYPNLAGYVARGEARPAYKRAFDAQLAVYIGKPPTVRLGSKSSSEFFVQFMGPVPSFLGLEPQLLGHSAREQGEEKSQHYRSRDLLYCGVSLRQPRPRLHPKNAHTRSLAENALTARAGYPAPHNHTTICFGLIAALTNGTDRQSFQYRGCISRCAQAAITRYAPCVSLAAKEAPNLVRKTCQLASHFGGRIDRRDISSFDGILIQL
jgi:hypothetical protein